MEQSLYDTRRVVREREDKELFSGFAFVIATMEVCFTHDLNW